MLLYLQQQLAGFAESESIYTAVLSKQLSLCSTLPLPGRFCRLHRVKDCQRICIKLLSFKTSSHLPLLLSAVSITDWCMTCFSVIVVASGQSLFCDFFIIIVNCRLVLVSRKHPLFTNFLQMFSELFLLFLWLLHSPCWKVFIFSYLILILCALHSHKEVIFRNIIL